MKSEHPHEITNTGRKVPTTPSLSMIAGVSFGNLQKVKGFIPIPKLLRSHVDIGH